MKLSVLSARSVLVLLAFSAWLPSAFAQDDFANDFPSTIKFSEKRHESVHYVAADEDYSRYYDAATVAITAKASLQGVDLATIGPDTDVELSLGNFTFSAVLGDSPSYQPGDKTIKFKFDADGDEVEESSVTVRYDAASVTFTVNVSRDFGASYSPVASSLEGSEYAPGEYQEVLTGAFSFGDRALSGRNVYAVGTRVAINSKRVGAGTDLDQTFDDLADVLVDGEADSDGPKLIITAPAADLTVHEAAFTITGTASDPNDVAGVQVQLNGGDWEDAELADDGTWTLQETLIKGANLLLVQTTDGDGNLTTAPARHVRFAPLTTLTVNAAGTGAGTVAAPWLTTLTYRPGEPSPVNTAVDEEDRALTLTATPSPGSVFDGWTSNAPLTAEQAASAALHFTLAPDLTLTAHFLPNPFLSTTGGYSGLITAAQPAQRGFFKLKIDAKGTFTGVVRIGALSLSLRGKFSNSGHFTGQFVKGGVAYSVTLDQATASDGGRQVLGTISGGAISATLASDRLEFNKTTPAPQQGAYHLALVPAAENTDANFPVGHGYGKVTVGKTGLVRFTGKLGDGTAVTFGASLSKAGTWPFFAALYGRAGSISGTVAFADLAESDLTGRVDWFKPAGLKAQTRFTEGFGGQSEIGGVKFSGAPPPGVRLILKADGAGVLIFEAPAAIAKSGALPEISSDDSVTLSVENRLTVPVDARQLKFVIAPTTGSFSGSFVSTPGSVLLKTTFRGTIITPKGTFAGSATGHFIWGDRTGAVSLGASQ